MKATPYIGVVSARAHPAIAAQLGLSEGFGLVVEEVLPESPAQAAGIQRYDVLKLLNDQQLFDPVQLGALIRSLGKDREINLTLMRKGQEQKLSIKIGEKMLPERAPDNTRGFFAPPELRRGGGGHIPPKPFQDPSDGPAKPRLPGGAHLPDRGHDSSEIRHAVTTYAHSTAGWGGAGRPGSSSRSLARMRDHNGEVEISTENGKRSLTVRNAAGETVFAGPIDTPEQRNAVPDEYRARLADLESAPPPPPPHGSAEGATRTADSRTAPDVQ